MFTFTRLISVSVVIGLLALPGAAAQDSPDPAKLKVEFTGGKLVVSGKKLTLPFPRQELIKLLGKPSRTAPGANTVLTWDELGIHAYQDRLTEKIKALQVTMDPESMIMANPKKMFSGAVKVEGTVVTAAATLETLNRAVKPKAFVLEQNLSNLLRVNHWTVDYGATMLVLRAADPLIKTEKANFSSLQLSLKDAE